MTPENIYSTIFANFENLYFQALIFLPNLLFGLVVFLLGLAVASVVGRIIGKIFEFLPVDEAVHALRFDKTLARAKIKFTAYNFFGGIAYWFVLLGFLMASFAILNLSVINDFLKDIFFYLPNVFVAVLILFVGLIVARFISEALEKGFELTAFKNLAFVGNVAKWLIVITTIFFALNQLGIAQNLIQTLFAGFVIMIALAGGLAFGLGGKDLAREILEKLKTG